ncbi:MAG TPA: glycosyltransferase family 2 protein [Solirubrobacteraceae bacterium]|jgi:GT2 family glycosyltransferase|nr:glycosyltransferase family 2 protein [Solirubrobacteraceae bacterium]
MDAERWRAEQIRLREAIRAQRSSSERHGSVGPAARPLASAIVVCWNSADVLGRCLERLLAQDYANYEIVVVDDGSRDDTLQVAERAARRGELRIVRSARNRGCPHARNLGLRHAKGEILAFVDADGYAATDWLSRIVDAFEADATVGAVASTVFFDANPLVINGAGGTVNRQGWAADLSMNEPYERAEIAAEALYPMGCGMAVRGSALERVGPFDERMRNYYDDVDYGARLWRAGWRVRVAPDAWIDHGFGAGGGDADEKRLLCERHRMRVVLKHACARTLARWAMHEARAVRGASWPGRALKLRAMAWNARHLPSVLASRRRLRSAPRVPDRLIDPAWGDGFPAGVPARLTPRPERAGSAIDMADAGSEGQLLYGWFPAERSDGRSRRWAGVRAAALIALRAPARRLRLDYAHVPADIGGVELSIRRVGACEPLRVVWSTRLPWQYMARSVENRPLALPAGDYEVVFATHEGWSDPPHETRALGFALASMSFEESYEIASGGLDMAAPAVEEQLVSGWFEAEQSAGRSYRWAAAHAEAIVRLAEGARSVCLSWRFPPGPTRGLNISVRPLDSRAAEWSTRIAWRPGEWHEETLALALPAGDYVVAFDAEATWSNPGRREPDLPPENRSLGFALSSLSFEG